MSETDEPPAKVIKINNDQEISIPELENSSADIAGGEASSELVMKPEDTIEEGQEEWLSEGILTDDDYTPNTVEDMQQSEESQTSQLAENTDTTTNNEPVPQAIPTPHTEAISAKTVELNIEETLNQMDGKDKDDDLQGDLDAFMEKNNAEIRASKNDDGLKEEKDDGNDTDDLLRMLGEDDGKAKKKLTKTAKDVRHSIKDLAASSDEDDFEYDSSVKKIKAVKSVITKKAPPKAVPEDMGDGDDDDTGLSSEEGKNKGPPRKKIYNVPKPNILAKKVPTTKKLEIVKKPPPEPKQIMNIVEKPGKSTSNSNQIVTQQVMNMTPTTTSRSILKTAAPDKIVASTPKPARAQIKKTKEPPKKLTFQPIAAKPPTTSKSNSILKPTVSKPKPVSVDEEKVKNDEFDKLKDDKNDDIDSDFERELAKTRQRILKPETMDEEVPSDGASHTEDGSLYDEMPSSGSEDIDDWFQIDVRNERATDYLPLLGEKAREVLLEEKKRVGDRINTLRQSLAALTETGKRQAENLRAATLSLAEIDDMLKAS